jgi:hypothetical protein
MTGDLKDQLQNLTQQFRAVVEQRVVEVAAIRAHTSMLIEELDNAFGALDDVFRPLEEILRAMRHARPDQQVVMAEQIMGMLARCSDQSEHLATIEHQIQEAVATLEAEISNLHMMKKQPGSVHPFMQIVAALRPVAKHLVESDAHVETHIRNATVLIAQLQPPLQQP